MGVDDDDVGYRTQAARQQHTPRHYGTSGALPRAGGWRARSCLVHDLDSRWRQRSVCPQRCICLPSPPQLLQKDYTALCLALICVSRKVYPWLTHAAHYFIYFIVCCALSLSLSVDSTLVWFSSLPTCAPRTTW